MNLLHDWFKDMDMRQNLVLPPEDLKLWTKDDKEGYGIWKEGKNKQNTEEDYRKVIIQLNKDYNIEEIYNQVEAGISALERLLDFSKLVPTFDVEKDIEDAYGENIRIEKDFIKFGLNFVKSFEANSNKAEVMTDSPQLSQLDKSGLITEHIEQIEVAEEETAVMDVKPEPGKISYNSEAKSSKVEEVGKDDSTPVHNEGVASVQVEVRRKKKKRRSK